jgi:ribosomal protein L27
VHFARGGCDGLGLPWKAVGARRYSRQRRIGRGHDDTIWADTDGEWNGAKNSYMSVA